MMTKRLIYVPVLSGVLVAAMISIPRPAAADPLLPPATYFESASRQGVIGGSGDTNVQSDQVGTVSVPVLNTPVLASATTAVRLSGDNTLNPFLSNYQSIQQGFQGFSYATITYSFEVLGPAGAQVPLDIALNASHTYTPFFQGPPPDSPYASATIAYAVPSDQIYEKSCSYQDGCNFASNSTDLIATNQVLNVFLNIAGFASEGISQASLDDTIAIDPANTVPGANLVFSPNLVVSTPEPGTFWSLLTGFLACMAWKARPRKSEPADK